MVIDTVWAYTLSLSGFLVVALWYMLFGRKIRRLEVMLPIVMVFITLGVLSLKYIDVLPPEYVAWFKYPTLIMSFVGSMAMLLTTFTKNISN